MKKNPLYNLLFALLILILAIIAKVDRDGLIKTSFQESIQGTSLSASTKTSLPTSFDNNYARDLASIDQMLLDADNGKTIPRKKIDVVPPSLKAQAALARDLESGTELFSLNNLARWPMASLTKLMTAVIDLENVGKEKNIPITEKAWTAEGIAGNFQIGEIYKANDLVRAMLVVSSNKAAAAISEFYGDSNFMEAMQKKAIELGMSQTTYSDPTGLSFLNQSTTNDLEKLIRYILTHHPDLLDITSQREAKILEINSNKQKTLTNINYFAGRPDFVGGKTGFIDAASGNLISVFKYNNHQILIIIFGTEDKFGQTELLYNWIKESFEF